MDIAASKKARQAAEKERERKEEERIQKERADLEARHKAEIEKYDVHLVAEPALLPPAHAGLRACAV